jgi:hypothetical protein
MSGKAIVLDANILIRAVLGKRVRTPIFANSGEVKFFSSDAATWTSDRVALYFA